MSEQTEIDKWWLIGCTNGWKMPSSSLFQRLPIIRHARTLYLAVRSEIHYSQCIGIRSGYDEWVLWGMWRGLREDHD